MSRKEFTDKVSISGCAFIASLTVDELTKKFSFNPDDIMLDKVWTKETYYKCVIKFCKKCFSERKEGFDYITIPQKYKYAGGKSSGRIYVDGFGVQSLQADIRKIITGDYYKDIDIKNCHWNVLLGMIQQYNTTYLDDEISYDHINKYCKNREEVLKKTKSTKLDLLVLLNIDNFKTKDKFLRKLHAEKMEAFNTFLENDDWTSLYGEDEISTTNEKNPVSSQVNKMFCINENAIIQEAIKDEHDLIVPMFDGFMFDASIDDPYKYELIDVCPKDSPIQWDYKSNISTDEDYLQFKKTFNPNDEKYLNSDMMSKIITAIDNNEIIDGGVLDNIIDWLYKLCGEDIIYYDNLYYVYKNGIYKKDIAEASCYELEQILKNKIVPLIHEKYNSVAKLFKAFKMPSDDELKDEAKAEKNKLKFEMQDWKELLTCISSIRRTQQTLGKYVSRSKNENKDFFNKIDSKDELIAFNNGVWDLYKGEFRSLEKTDFISTTTEYDYVEPSETLMKEFEELYLNKVFPTIEIRTHFLKSLCSSLDGNKRRHKFSIWSNFGRNGKSLTMDLLSKMLGSYYGVMNSSVLQGSKNEGGSASPQYEVLKTCRIVSMNEPEVSKKLNSNLIKELSGGDKISMRRLYSGVMEEFKPKASLSMLCNDIPNMDRSEGAVMNRLDIIPFESTFGIRPDKSIITEDNYELKEFITDNEIENKLVKWRCCFFKTIVSHFQDYLKNPNFSLKSEMNDEYTADQDLVKEFMDEKLVKGDNYKVKIKDIIHHLNKYLKSRSDKIYNSRSLAKYYRMNKFKCEKQGSDTYLFNYNFSWLCEESNGCMIEEDALDHI